MDDLEALATLLAKPGPSGELVGRGRRRLQQATREPVRRRPSGRLVGGLALGLAAAVAAVVVVVPGSKVPGTRPLPGATPVVSSAPDHRSGRQILLAAATSAERSRPAQVRTGTSR